MKRLRLLSLAIAALTALSVTTVSAYTVPNTTDLLFGLNTDSFPASGNMGAWTRTDPAGGTFTTLGTPTVDPVGTAPVKWEKNTYAGATGFSGGTQASAVPINGATIVTVIKPVRSGDTGNWRSIVDVLYDQFCLVIANSTGQLGMRRGTGNGTGTSGNLWGPTIANQQSTVVSVVMAPDGSFQMYTNGTLAWTYSTTTTLTQFYRSSLNTWGIGRNTFDGWSTFNGDIGDVYVWKIALADADRVALENDLMAKFHAGPNYPANTLTASVSGSGGTMTPSGTVSLPYEADQTFSITVNYGYLVDVVVDGVSQGNLASYTFTDVVANHTIAANFSPLPTRTISGNVAAKAGGGATVSVKLVGSALPAQQTTTDASGNYTMVVPDAAYYVCASQTGYLISADTASGTGNQVINFTLTPKRNIPKMEYLLFAADSTDLGAVGTSGNWNLLYQTCPWTPASTVLTAIASPQVNKVRGIKYDYNLRADGDGYRLNNSIYASPIPCSGATVVAVVKPVRNSTSDGWNSVVDIFRDNLVLGVFNGGANAGKVYVDRNGTTFTSTAAIPDGQLTILSLVVQPDGTWKVWASPWNSTNNQFGAATVFFSSTATSAFNAFIPAQMGPDDWRKYIDIGRNNGDGWSTFNGYIGDTFVYKCALSDADRAVLEADINTKTTNITTYVITATAGTNGSISPAGVTAVGETDNQSYTITPAWGYNVADVLVDNVSVGAVTNYTFTNVVAAHTIAASFAVKPLHVVSGQVTAAATSSPIAGAKVYVSSATNASFNPAYTLTTDASGNYSVNLFDGPWYFTASATGYTTPADTTVTVAGAAVSDVNFALVGSGKLIPQMDQLIFSLYAGSLTTNGATTSPWPLDHPQGRTATVMGTPVLTTVDGLQWEQNRYGTGDGYRIGQYLTRIPVTGVTATAVVQPNGDGSSGGNWTSIIDVLYSRLVLGIRGTDGTLRVNRNGEWTDGPAIPNGQKTVLTVVVQPTGQYKVYANGVQVMDVTSTSDMTALVPGVYTGGPGNYDSYINVGRNNPDGWTTYSGNIGAAFLWKTALSDAERQTLEYNLRDTFMPGAATTTTTLTCSDPDPSMAGAMLTFTANVTVAGYGYVTGDVTFLDGANVLGTVALDGTGTATLATVDLTAGTHSITARYNGDWSNLSSTSAALTRHINADTRVATTTTLALTAGTNPSFPGDFLVFTATVVGNAPAGNVVFQDGTNVLNTFPVYGGQASLGIDSLALGSHAITATFLGDVNNKPSTSAALAQQVIRRSIAVGATGSGTNDFMGMPNTEWLTLSVAGGSGDVNSDADLDTAMASIDATNINTSLAIQAASGALGTAYFRTDDQKLGLQPTGNKMTLLMATLKNTSGSAMDTLYISYTMGVTLTPAEQISGHRVYWSKTGAAGSWTAAGDQLLVAPGTKPVKITLTGLGWANNDLLYVVWADDNANGGTEGDFTLDDIAFSPINPYPTGEINGTITPDDGNPTGFAVKLKNASGAQVDGLTTLADGKYSFTAVPGTYTVSVQKAGCVIMPAPQTVTLVDGAVVTKDFTSTTGTTIHGTLVDATTGTPIYNGVVQVGGLGGSALVTSTNGTYTLPGTGNGGVEIFADAPGYHCTNLLVTVNGTDLLKKIALCPEVEEGVLTNGGFELVADGLPSGWGEFWTTGGLQFCATNVPYSGSNSVWFTGTASYSALAQYVPVTPDCVYNCYFKAKADPGVTQWFPMFSFRSAADGEMKGWISGETGFDGYVHNPPKDWMQYLRFHTYSGDATQPFIRIAPPTGAVALAASFCYATLPPAGQGCYVDDVVIDKVPAVVPLVTVAADPTTPPTPTLPLTGFSLPAGTPTFVVPTVSGYQYRLVYKNNLTDASWAPVDSTWTAGTDGNVTLSDSGAAGQPHRFYRIEAK